MVEFVLDHSINHFDVAPTYGDAELKLGPKLRQHRDKIFLGCKTQERKYDEAKRKLEERFHRPRQSEECVSKILLRLSATTRHLIYTIK